MKFSYLYWALIAAIALVTLAPAGAAAPPAALAQPDDAGAVIAKMLDRNPTLQSYKARVHVDVHMQSFPWLSPKLDGTATYKRPDSFDVVFDRMPGYAKGFQKLFDDIGDPAAWEKDQNISVDGASSLDGHQVIVLKLTKKIYSTILDHTLAYVDAGNYELLQMEWYYTSGGKIVMSQQYRDQGGYSVISAQHATINIPHVRAVADASYGSYQTNVAADAAETSKP